MSGPPSLRTLEDLLGSAGIGVAIFDGDLRFRYVNARMGEINGMSPEAHLGRPLADVLPDIAQPVEDLLRDVLRTGDPIVSADVAGSTAVAHDRHWQASYLPIATPDGPAVGALVHDVTDRVAAIEEARRRVRQQTLVADLGQRALRGGSIEDLLDSVCSAVRDALDADFTGILFPAQDEGELVMRAGAGWPSGAMGRVTAPLGTRSQAGYSLMTGGPVVMRDAASEERFQISGGLRAQGIASAISAPIPADPAPQAVFGVLSRRVAHFDDDDAGFVRGVAHVVGYALRNDEQRQQLEEVAEQRGRLVAQALEAGEREQRKVADVLHDDVLQHLLSARLELSSGDAASLERVHTSLAHAADLVRSVAASLHPVTLSHAGLGVAVERVAADHAARGRIDVVVDVDRAAEGRADRLLVSLVREMLTNVVKHAGARRARVAVAPEGAGVVLRVADDGRGLPAKAIDAAPSQGSLGLAYARERVEALGGRLEIGAGLDGAGTAITVRLPAPAED